MYRAAFINLDLTWLAVLTLLFIYGVPIGLIARYIHKLKEARQQGGQHDALQTEAAGGKVKVAPQPVVESTPVVPLHNQ